MDDNTNIYLILDRFKYKGTYLSVIKELDVWRNVLENTKVFSEFSEKERLYLFLNPEEIPYCENNRPKRFISIQIEIGRAHV